MKKLLSFLASRWFLAFVALILLSLGIWFMGPYVAFGGLRPLESVALRIALIALIFCGVLLWLLGWSTASVFGAFFCLLIWHASPLLSFGDMRPFAPVAARVIALSVVIALFAAWALYRLWQRMRQDEQFLRKALALNIRKDKAPATARLQEIELRMKAAIGRLKVLRTRTPGIAKPFQRSRHLYELPWYLALGSAGSGKTRAILNAGLSVPAGNAPLRGSVSAPGSAVDWWLTNEAVFIDSAGFYVHPGTSKHVLPLAAPGDSDNPSRAEDALYRRGVDTDEWFGLLRLLRRHRPRAPINGALLTIQPGLLLDPDPAAREAEAHALRTRLDELRTTLGIRFPVYVIVTQMDRLPGFADYFASLTEESRAQIWGFTLPIDEYSPGQRCADELAQLADRLSIAVNTRLEDEYDMERRRRLAAFPDEFDALVAPLADLLVQLFLDSRFDDTQHRSMLRGVYFTSATQSGTQLAADRLTIVRRLASGLDRPLQAKAAPVSGTQSFFLRDAFTKVILPEAHLVRPNLRWEYRSRMLRLVGHALAILLFVWLALSLHASFGNNIGYLRAVAHKTSMLSAKVARLYREPKPELIPDTLDEARDLPSWTGVNLASPDASVRYGLYTAPGVIDVSGETYRALEDHLLLPEIVRRLETVLAQAMVEKDAKTSYAALRIYLMLYDRSKFDAKEVKAWVFDDWSRTGSASVFGGRATMLGHVDQLFSGERVVQSPLIRNDALIERARAFLDDGNVTQRIYERAKAAMQQDAPDDFTLLRAVGAQAGTIFRRESGEPVSRGVPGLFTVRGYRDVFDKRLEAFARDAREDDAWVVGRGSPANRSDAAQKKTLEIASTAAGADDPLTDAIRRLYLTEYTRHWTAFLADVRPVTGSGLAFDLQVLRQFAAPDSPLARLARAAARETTLTQKNTHRDDTLIDQATRVLADKTRLPDIRAQERVERALVDDEFAPLREMVTGSAQAQTDTQAPGAQAGKTGLDGVMTLLNETYTSLSIAANALANNGLPPASDAAARLKMAADTMPAPFRELLRGLAKQGAREVNWDIGQLLSRQMQAVVGDACRLAIEGSYPFAPESNHDVGIEDFTRVFAQGGVIEDFFTRNLAPFVDTSSQPWRYKTLPGGSEPLQGPDLEPFQHAQTIRTIFFGDQGKQFAWKAELRVPELDPTISSLAIDIDGQTALYQHGPVTPLRFGWPGPRGGVHAEITASPRIRAETSTIAADGPWALMRLLHRGQIMQTATLGRTRVVFNLDGRSAAVDITSAGTLANPLTSNVLASFRCPSAMPMFNLADSGPPPGLPALSTAPPLR